MNNIEIIPFSREHINAVLSISLMSFITPWSRDSIEEELNNRLAHYVIAKKDNVVIGYGGIWLIAGEGHITNIAVHPEYRGIGTGNMIVEALTKLCREKNIASMTLEVRKSNITAQNLYKKYGFIEAGIRKLYYQDTKEDAVIMWKYDVLM